MAMGPRVIWCICTWYFILFNYHGTIGPLYTFPNNNITHRAWHILILPLHGRKNILQKTNGVTEILSMWAGKSPSVSDRWPRVSILFVESQSCPQIYQYIDNTMGIHIKSRKTVMIFNKIPGPGTINPSEAHEFTPIFSGVNYKCWFILVLYVWCFVDYYLSFFSSNIRFSLQLPIAISPLKGVNPAATPGNRNGTESFFGLKGRPSILRDV